MATLKPAAKALIIVTVLVAGGFGVNEYLDHRPKVAAQPKEVVQEAPVANQVTEVKTPEPVAKEEPAQAPEPAASTSNSGMDALLKHTK
jgi:hypothetical protein